MRAVVVYESMYGNTHSVAEHIALGLQSEVDDTIVVPVREASADTLAGADLLIVGGPTHAHGLSRAATREAAIKAQLSDSDLHLDPDAEGDGLREWFETLSASDQSRAAAFDTRIDMTPALTGRASKGIAKRLHRHGFDLVAGPESFLVDKESHLLPGEADRAREWGASLRSLVAH